LDTRNLSKKELGKLGEDLAADYLPRQGLKILLRNYRCPKGEMDLVAMEGDCLVFVEVRTRSSSSRGTAEESIRYDKLRRLKSIASYYLLERSASSWPPLRFDLLAINLAGSDTKINWIKNVS
jgi:putative endonuclease